MYFDHIRPPSPLNSFCIRPYIHSYLSSVWGGTHVHMRTRIHACAHMCFITYQV